ncbi:hypothetical protein B0H34DRAFT_719255, partial [Crassisporium funariophilum]
MNLSAWPKLGNTVPARQQAHSERQTPSALECTTIADRSPFLTQQTAQLMLNAGAGEERGRPTLMQMSELSRMKSTRASGMGMGSHSAGVTLPLGQAHRTDDSDSQTTHFLDSRHGGLTCPRIFDGGGTGNGWMNTHTHNQGQGVRHAEQQNGEQSTRRDALAHIGSMNNRRLTQDGWICSPPSLDINLHSWEHGTATRDSEEDRGREFGAVTSDDCNDYHGRKRKRRRRRGRGVGAGVEMNREMGVGMDVDEAYASMMQSSQYTQVHDQQPHHRRSDLLSSLNSPFSRRERQRQDPTTSLNPWAFMMPSTLPSSDPRRNERSAQEMPQGYTLPHLGRQNPSVRVSEQGSWNFDISGLAMGGMLSGLAIGGLPMEGN